jgi:hypothetical protein
VSDVNAAGGGGYLNVAPHSGTNMMLIHTSSNNSDRLWSTTIQVTPGQTYNFCAWIANAKATPVNGFTIQLMAGNTVIATANADFNWSSVCGTYTAPAGVTSIELSVKDPYPTFGPSHFLALDDICISGVAPNPVVLPYDRRANPVQPAYPNPAGRNFAVKVKASKTGTAMVNIVNLNGKIVSSQKVTVNAGDNSVFIKNINDITGGAYNLQIVVDGRTYNQKLIISR